VNILIVEDDVNFADALGELIESWGHYVEKSNTGNGALERVMQQMFDLILLDMFLPDAIGYELIPRFKEVEPTILIIAVTGYSSRELELKVRRQGNLYYMIKPFEIKYLRTILNHTLLKKIWIGILSLKIREDWRDEKNITFFQTRSGGHCGCIDPNAGRGAVFRYQGIKVP